MGNLNLHTQNKRLLRLATPLGDDVLMPLSAIGEDVMSSGFSVSITAFSERRHDLQPKDLVGKTATLVIIQEDNSERYLNGYVTGFETQGRTYGGQRSQYQLTLQPWLHLLDKSADCRIYQELSIPDVLKRAFSFLGNIANYTFNLQATHEPHRYLTQYNETTGNFMRRLLQREGIGFVIEHGNGTHTVRFFDDPDSLEDLAPEPVLILQSATPTRDHLTGWRHHGTFETGRFIQRSYNYKDPCGTLEAERQAAPAVQALSRASQIEQYCYSESYAARVAGSHGADSVTGSDAEGHHLVTGYGSYRHLQPGRHFTVKQIPAGDWIHHGAEFTFTRVAFETTDADGHSEFNVNFEALPKGEMIFPSGQQPRIASLQTALVTGPEGEEIFTDDLGRIKVRFHWDRDGIPGAETTCWLRVMQSFAGPGFGSQFTPRIGQEVVVAFENGNPDRPFVLGALYHPEHKPPYAGHNGTRTGIRTRSTKGGGVSNCNELYFEDETGKEEVYLQAERNFNGVIKYDENRKIGNNQTLEVSQNKVEKIGNNATQKIQKNLLIQAGETITLKVGSSTIKLTPDKIVIKSGVVDVDGGSVQVN